uniref:PLOD1-3-like GT domain-containing protein n=1 Tax=viral metagenome TaxID=1070528 RepID=A0A6C0JJ27_9ZZZZ
MFYIITYASHSERYFELLKQSCPDIIVLEKENKINATVKFCKSKNPDDIICFVDGYDSVVLTSKEKIIEKYKAFNTPLVFSKDFYPSSILTKYLQDKLYGKCKDKRLNSGLYIGTSESIIDFWKDIKEKEDDKSYANRQFEKKSYMKIDDEHTLFYNYSSLDTIEIKNKSLFINDNKISTSVISCPSNNSINHILSQLNYNNLPEIKYDYLTYAKYFIKEFILALLFVSIFIYFKNILFSIFVCFTIFFSFLEYELYVKYLDVPKITKLLYLFVDFIHICFCLFIVWLLLNFECNIKKLLLLDIIYFSVIASFFIYKRCILSMIANNILNKPNCPWNGYIHRLSYFGNIKKNYKTHYDTCKNYSNSESWINSNLFTIIPVVLLNIYCLWNIQTGTSCISKAGFGFNLSKKSLRSNSFKKKVK